MTQREDLELREEVSGQTCCRAESLEKSTGREAGKGPGSTNQLLKDCSYVVKAKSIFSKILKHLV